MGIPAIIPRYDCPIFLLLWLRNRITLSRLLLIASPASYVKATLHLLYLRFLPVVFLTIFSCSRQHDHVLDIPASVAGYVIAHEACSGVDSTEFWAIDLTYFPNEKQLGDSLTINGVKYTNVIKMKITDPEYRRVGKVIAVIYSKILPNKNTSPCSLSSPVTYCIKAMVPEAIGYPG